MHRYNGNIIRMRSKGGREKSMLFKILKGDLKRRKGVNIIIFLFVMLATIFLASSMNNIITALNATDYYMNYANIPDITIVAMGEKEVDEIQNTVNGIEGVGNCDMEVLYIMASNDITIVTEKGEAAYNADGSNIYVGADTGTYVKAYDKEGQPLVLADGEIALSKYIMDLNHLKVGDKIRILVGDTEKEYKIKVQAKDYAYGSKMGGMHRFLMNEKELQYIAKAKTESQVSMIYANTTDVSKVVDTVNNGGFQSILVQLTKSSFRLMYVFDIIIAALLVIVGICLILIALLVLRFTIAFTLEEDYKEIGIMKATGYKNGTISRIYLIKYFAIVSISSLLGCAISIPIGQVMIESVSQNMIMEDSRLNLGINVGSMLVIIVIIMLFCYGCAKRIYRISAVQAIRNGEKGERFSKLKGLKLHNKKSLPVIGYLGINDIASNIRRYLMLIITFCVSFVLITIPLNTLTTMNSKEMLRKFILDPEAQIFASNLNLGEKAITEQDVINGMEKLKKEVADVGYEGKISVCEMYTLNYQKKGKDHSGTTITTIKILGNDGAYLDYVQGTAPVYKNEIAVSKQVLEENGWEIGDTLVVRFADKKEEMLITGSYTDYMQQGVSVRLNPKVDMGNQNLTMVWHVMLYLDSKEEPEQMITKLQKALPNYEWNLAKDIIDSYVGGVKESMEAMQLPMTILLAVVIMLITILMETLFIIREKGEIAMMKSIGFQNRQIRCWQVLRMVCVMLSSMVLSIPLSMLSNRYLLRPIFGVMGAELTIQVEPFKAYFIYPAVLLVAIIFATILATGKVKKIDIREMNNLE